jgi:hypothetical protein
MNLKTNPEILRLEAEMEKIQKQLLEVICSDEKLSKLDRLMLIENYKLFETDSWIQHPLCEKYMEQLKEATIREGATYFIDDSWPSLETDYRNRGEYISLPNELLCAAENIDDEDYADGFTVLRDRGTGVEIKISYEQLESDVYDWCLKNKKIGFNFDW